MNKNNNLMHNIIEYLQYSQKEFCSFYFSLILIYYNGVRKMECIFCKIIAGDIPSYTIYEDEMVKVFLDINPDVNGHLLIIPKQHYLGLLEIDDNILNRIMQTAREMEKLLKEKLNIDGLTLIQNNGSVQEVKHYHLHLKPHYNNKQDIKPVEEVYNLLTK